MDEIQLRADKIGRPYLTLGEIADITGISRVTIWRLPEGEKPDTFLMAGAQMMSTYAAVEWAKKYWAKKGVA